MGFHSQPHSAGTGPTPFRSCPIPSSQITVESPEEPTRLPFGSSTPRPIRRLRCYQARTLPWLSEARFGSYSSGSSSFDCLFVAIMPHMRQLVNTRDVGGIRTICQQAFQAPPTRADRRNTEGTPSAKPFFALRQNPHFACRIGLTLTPPPAPPLSLAAKRWGRGGAKSRSRASDVDFALEPFFRECRENRWSEIKVKE